jgi:hypothetical protein
MVYLKAVNRHDGMNASFTSNVKLVSGVASYGIYPTPMATYPS